MVKTQKFIFHILLLMFIATYSYGQCSYRHKQNFSPEPAGGEVTLTEYNTNIQDELPTGAYLLNTEIEVELFVKPEFISKGLNGLEYPITVEITNTSGTLDIRTFILSSTSPSKTIKFKVPSSEHAVPFTVKAGKLTHANIPQMFMDNDIHGQFVAGVISISATYNLDVTGSFYSSSPSMNLQAVQPNLSAKGILFNMNSVTDPFCELELEILKLENEKSSNSSSRICYSRLNWANSARFIFDRSSSHNILINMMQGTGFYAWRMRRLGRTGNSIGSGITASEYTSVNLDDTLEFKLDAHNNPIPINNFQVDYFYFKDPDSSRNNIFQRVFKDANGVKEKISYADNLNNIRQTQVHLPSKSTIVVEETLLDKEQRPAVKSLPVPKETNHLGYIPKLMSIEDTINKKFSRKHFDSNISRKLPNVIANPNGYDYYGSNENTDFSLGVPYSRRRFANDNSKRDVEIGLPGLKLGFNSNEIHTTRTIEASATDEELVKWFGKDAPLGINVSKIINIDPNGTVTTTYKSVDGKVVATAINLESRDDSMLLPLNTSNVGFTSRDQITKNASISNIIIASKPLYLADSGTVQISYNINNSLPDTACAVTSVSCLFDVKVSVKRIDGIKLKTCAGGFGSCAYYNPIDSISLRWILDTTANELISIISGLHNVSSINKSYTPLRLPAGNYTITKEIFPSSNTSTITSIGTKLNTQVGPLSRLFTKWMDSIKSPCEFDKFQLKVRNLRDSVALFKKSMNGITDSLLIHKYLKQDLNEHSYTSYFNNVDTVLVATNGQSISFSTKCCPNFTIPIGANFLFSGTPIIVNTNPAINDLIEIDPMGIGKCGQLEYQYDFEGYAYKFFYNCVDDKVRNDSGSLTPPKNIKGWSSMTENVRKTYTAIHHKYLKRFMPGYTNTGLFNILVYKMLTDKYKLDNDTAPRVHYDPSDLIKCWQAQLEVIKQNVGGCNGKDTLAVSMPTFNSSISNGIDEANGNNTSVHDDAINSNVRLNPFLEFLGFGNRARKQASEDVRNSQANVGGAGFQASPVNVDFSYNVVENFMECAGYKFARIMTQYDSLPLPEDIATGVKYGHASNWFYNPKSGSVTHEDVSRIDTAYITSIKKYRPIVNYFSSNPGASGRRTGIFTTMRHPVWIYKYQHFPLDSMKDVELSSCFADPNFSYTVNSRIPLCPGMPDSLCNFCSVGKVKCNRDRLSWSSAERYAFFKLVQKIIPGSVGITVKSDGMDGRDYLSPVFSMIDPATNQRASHVNVWGDSTRLDNNEYASLISRQFKRFDTSSSRLLTRAEFEINAANRTMVNTIEGKRPTYRAMLIDSLVSKGYVIDSCVDANCLNKITQGEIDLILDEIIKEAKHRSMVSTFRTVSDSCRAIKTPVSLLGHVDESGRKILKTELVLGSGKSDTIYSPVYLNYRQVSNRELFSVDTTQKLQARVYDPAQDQMISKDIYMVEQDAPMCQNTLRQQVNLMFMHIVIQPPAITGLNDPVPDTCCTDSTKFSQKQDCPTCLTAIQRQSDNFTLPKMPTAVSRVRMDVVLNRKRLVSNRKRYQHQ